MKRIQQNSEDFKAKELWQYFNWASFVMTWYIAMFVLAVERCVCNKVFFSFL